MGSGENPEAAGNCRLHVESIKYPKAERFFVPDDHVDALVQKIQSELNRAVGNGNERVAAVWRRELARVTSLGRTYPELETAVTTAGKRAVQVGAMETAGGATVLVFAVDGAIVCYLCSQGELAPTQTEQAVAESAVKAGAVGLATGVILLGANPAGITVIVVGGVVYLVADYAIDELRSSYVSSPMTPAEIDQVMPAGWHRVDP